MAKAVPKRERPARTYFNGDWIEGSPPILAPNT
jgi:hypothetical protein